GAGPTLGRRARAVANALETPGPQGGAGGAPPGEREANGGPAMTRHERRALARIAERAGIAGSSRSIIYRCPDSPWSVDDKKWFAAHPSRSHRLRPAHDGELPELLRAPPQLPPHFETQVLVRQVEPRLRVPGPFHP